MDDCGNIFFLIIGILMFINSPYLVRFSKKNNSVTQEHKFIWDREYKITKLCKITDIKEVKKYKFNWFVVQPAILITKSGKEIFTFPIFFRRDGRTDTDKINTFLTDKSDINTDLILKEGILRIIGSFLIVVGLLTFLP